MLVVAKKHAKLKGLNVQKLVVCEYMNKLMTYLSLIPAFLSGVVGYQRTKTN